MLIYNNNGTVSNIQINAIIDGVPTSSLVTAPTIQAAFFTSASNATLMNAINAGSSSKQAIELAYPSGSRNRNGRR